MTRQEMIDDLVKRGFRGSHGMVRGESIRSVAEALYDRLYGAEEKQASSMTTRLICPLMIL